MCVRLPYQDVHFHDYFTVEVAAEYTIFDSQFPLSCNTVHTESLSRSLTHSETADATLPLRRLARTQHLLHCYNQHFCR